MRTVLYNLPFSGIAKKKILICIDKYFSFDFEINLFSIVLNFHTNFAMLFKLTKN